MKKLNLKDFKQIKDGRWINKTTGYFVRKPLSTKLSKLSKNNHKKINYPSQRAYNIIKIREYKDKSFSLDFGNRGTCDSRLLYYAEYLREIAMCGIRKQAKETHKHGYIFKK